LTPPEGLPNIGDHEVIFTQNHNRYSHLGVLD
jgi:hypothetical protein